MSLNHPTLYTLVGCDVDLNKEYIYKTTIMRLAIIYRRFILYCFLLMLEVVMRFEIKFD